MLHVQYIFLHLALRNKRFCSNKFTGFTIRTIIRQQKQPTKIPKQINKKTNPQTTMYTFIVRSFFPVHVAAIAFFQRSKSWVKGQVQKKPHVLKCFTVKTPSAHFKCILRSQKCLGYFTLPLVLQELIANQGLKVVGADNSFQTQLK